MYIYIYRIYARFFVLCSYWGGPKNLPRLLCSFFLVLTCSLIEILIYHPKKEPHTSFQVVCVSMYIGNGTRMYIYYMLHFTPYTIPSFFVSFCFYAMNSTWVSPAHLYPVRSYPIVIYMGICTYLAM